MISMWSMPRKPQRKPKPSASELSGVYCSDGVVEGQLLQRFAEVFEIVGADREQTGVNLRLDALEAWQHSTSVSSSGSGCHRPAHRECL